MSSKKFDIVLLGATSYTGTVCAEYINKSFPTDLRWAIAGRSAVSLGTLRERLKLLNPNREQPGNPSLAISRLLT
jgi:short subunit dehydrogenase-like uncharacterized protein